MIKKMTNKRFMRLIIAKRYYKWQRVNFIRVRAFSIFRRRTVPARMNVYRPFLSVLFFQSCKSLAYRLHHLSAGSPRTAFHNPHRR